MSSGQLANPKLLCQAEHGQMNTSPDVPMGPDLWMARQTQQNSMCKGTGAEKVGLNFPPS